MDLNSEIYCTYSNEKVKVSDCMSCFFLYDCDNSWCNNHKCDNCENKNDDLCGCEL